MGAPPPPSHDGIAAAARAIDPVFLDSPLTRHDALDDRLGCRLVAKVETLNPIRSFKGRGTSWFLTAAGADDARLVTASAGNFGQGLAYAARSHDRALTVFAATTANPLKVAAMERLGAVVRLEGRDFDEAKIAAAAFAEESGARLVVDGDHPAIAEGAGTIARELTTRHPEPVDALVVPLGNGALATGVGTWMKHAAPATRVVAVAARGAPSMAASWHEGRIVETDRADTIADGIAVRVPIPYAVETMRGTVDEVLLVSDESILTAMRLVLETLGLLVEPAGVAGLAAVLAEPAQFAGQTVATVLCGSNLTPAQINAWLASGSEDRS
jgi:threonine dehydratase